MRVAAGGLTREDLEQALEFVGRVQGATDLDSYRREVVGIKKLIGGHISSYNEIDIATGRVFSLTDPSLTEQELALFTRLSHQNPLIAYHAEHDDPGEVVALSDVTSVEELHATDLYRLFYSRLEVEDQIAMVLLAPPGQTIAAVVNRRARGFDDRDRALLELVRPHAIQSFRMVREAEDSRRQIAALRARLDESGSPPSLDEIAAESGLTARQRTVLELLARGRRRARSQTSS